MRDQLLESGYKEEDLIPIPVGVSMTRHSAMENLSSKQRTKPEKKGEGKSQKPDTLSIHYKILECVCGGMGYEPTGMT